MDHYRGLGAQKMKTDNMDSFAEQHSEHHFSILQTCIRANKENTDAMQVRNSRYSFRVELVGLGTFHTAVTCSWLHFIGYVPHVYILMKWISHYRYAKKYCDMLDMYQNFVTTSQHTSNLRNIYRKFHSFKTCFNTHVAAV